MVADSESLDYRWTVRSRWFRKPSFRTYLTRTVSDSSVFTPCFFGSYSAIIGRIGVLCNESDIYLKNDSSTVLYVGIYIERIRWDGWARSFFSKSFSFRGSRCSRRTIHEQMDSSIYKLYLTHRLECFDPIYKFWRKTTKRSHVCRNGSVYGSGNYLCFYVTNKLLTLRSRFDNNGIADRG